MGTLRGILNDRQTRKKFVAVIVIAFILAPAALSVLVYAAEPGSAADPIALKSYVDSRLDSLETKLTGLIQGGGTGGAGGGGGGSGAGAADLGALEARIAELEKMVEWLEEANASIRRSIRQPIAAPSGEVTEVFTPIEVFENQRIIFGGGAEAVLRTGKALAIRGESGALVDLISGRDLDAGEDIPINHLILSSRDDSRGMRITADAWVLVKGPYELR